MTRQRKHPKQPSIIDSDLDNCFSLSDTESESGLDESEAPPMVTPPPTQPTQKRPKLTTASVESHALINYVLALFSMLEMTKLVSKRVSKSFTLQLRSDTPLDTLKAQMLVKISAAFNPPVLDITHYDIMFTITRVVSKPGILIVTEADYGILLEKALGKGKTMAIVNLVITQLVAFGEKENIALDAVEDPKSKKKKAQIDPDTLPGNINRTSQIWILQERWACKKKQPTCMGTFCFVGNSGTHLPLSHSMLDCWASSIVSPSSRSLCSQANPLQAQGRRSCNHGHTTQSSPFRSVCQDIACSPPSSRHHHCLTTRCCTHLQSQHWQGNHRHLPSHHQSSTTPAIHPSFCSLSTQCLNLGTHLGHGSSISSTFTPEARHLRLTVPNDTPDEPKARR